MSGLGWTNVVSYGATGNGSTDDTTAIAAAITALPATGGILYFPPGTYLISSTLTITTNNVTVLGAGRYVSVLKAAVGLAGSDMLTFGNGSTSCTGGGVSALGFDSASTKSGGAGIYFNKCMFMTIEDVALSHQYNGIHVGNNSSVIRITDADIYTSALNGIWVDGGNGTVNDIYISRVVADNSPAATGSGIYVSGGDAVIAEHCDFLHFANGLLLEPTSGKKSRWNFFTAVMFDYCTNDGIHLGGDAGDIYGCTFTNCWASSNTGQGVYIGTGTGATEGISITSSRFITNGQAGIDLHSPATNIVLADNLIEGNSTSSSGTYSGIKVGAGVVHVSITGNRAYNGLGHAARQGYGLDFATSSATDYIVVQGNDFSSNISGGINNAAGATGANQSISGNL